MPSTYDRLRAAFPDGLPEYDGGRPMAQWAWELVYWFEPAGGRKAGTAEARGEALLGLTADQQEAVRAAWHLGGLEAAYALLVALKGPMPRDD